jgi:hypothetical protein
LAGRKSSWDTLLQYSFIAVLADDGRLDESELEMLKGLSLEDGAIDEMERAVLSRIFARVTRDNASEETLAEISAFKGKYRIP